MNSSTFLMSTEKKSFTCMGKLYMVNPLKLTRTIATKVCFKEMGNFRGKKVYLLGYVEDPHGNLVFDDDSAITANVFIMQVQAFIWFFGGGFSKNTTYDLSKYL